MTAIRGSNNLNYAEVGPGRASGLHVINKPTDVGTLGQYRLGLKTGIIAAGAQTDGEIFQFRWAHATNLAIIKKVAFTGMLTGATGFSAGALVVKLTKSYGVTVLGTGTGSTTTAPILLGNTSVNGAGVLSFTTLSQAPYVGQTITINGTMTTGTINGSATQTNAVYYVTAASTSTATLSLTPGGATVSSQASTGAFTGATCTLSSTLQGDNAKLRTNFATSSDFSAAIAGTAVLGAGTRTGLNFHDTGLLNAGAPTTANTSAVFSNNELLDMDMSNGEHPLVLAQNEGFVIRVTCPATGTWSTGINLQWAEVGAF